MMRAWPGGKMTRSPSLPLLLALHNATFPTPPRYIRSLIAYYEDDLDIQNFPRHHHCHYHYNHHHHHHHPHHPDEEGWGVGSVGGRASKAAPKKDLGSLGG